MRQLIQHRPRESTGPSLYAPDEVGGCVESLAPPSRVRWALRREKGRNLSGTHTFKRVDTGEWVTLPTDTLDPILLLAVHRKNWCRSEYHAEQYGVIRQRVVSPVLLPADIAPMEWRSAA